MFFICFIGSFFKPNDDLIHLINISYELKFLPKTRWWSNTWISSKTLICLIYHGKLNFETWKLKLNNYFVLKSLEFLNCYCNTHVIPLKLKLKVHTWITSWLFWGFFFSKFRILHQSIVAFRGEKITNCLTLQTVLILLQMEAFLLVIYENIFKMLCNVNSKGNQEHPHPHMKNIT